jgi:DNA-binding XRE family transcriptional regulator
MVSMSQDPLTTYLLTYRKRTGLSQGEMAFLLGISSGTTGVRKPFLRATLSYEIILGEPTSELFAGWYLELESAIRKRAARLRKHLSALPPTPANVQKLKSIHRLLEEPKDSLSS